MVPRALAAEAVGPFVLVFFAVGTAVFGIDDIGSLGVAVAFGLVLLGLAYAIGPVSGCHVNPAVTLGVWLARRTSAREAGGDGLPPPPRGRVAGGPLKGVGCLGGGQGHNRQPGAELPGAKGE